MKTSSYIIIGGGVSGTLTACHLARRTRGARILLIEPRPEAGLGLAYSTPSLRHLLNVPAGKISVLREQPYHFLHWAQRHYDPALTESDFAPRAIFGKYIQSLLAKTPEVEHLQATAVHCRLDDGRAVVTLENGSTVAGRRGGPGDGQLRSGAAAGRGVRDSTQRRVSKLSVGRGDISRAGPGGRDSADRHGAYCRGRDPAAAGDGTSGTHYDYFATRGFSESACAVHTPRAGRYCG